MTLSGVTIPGPSGHGSNGNEGVLHIPQSSLEPYHKIVGGARGVMVIVAGCGHDDTSSNPGRA